MQIRDPHAAPTPAQISFLERLTGSRRCRRVDHKSDPGACYSRGMTTTQTRIMWALIAVAWFVLVVVLWQSSGCSVETPC